MPPALAPMLTRLAHGLAEAALGEDVGVSVPLFSSVFLSLSLCFFLFPLSLCLSGSTSSLLDAPRPPVLSV